MTENPTESAIFDFLSHSFFEDFVFRNPAYTSSEGRREVQDLLVLLNDQIVAVQAKARFSRGRVPTGANARRETAWARKNIGAALRQLKVGHSRMRRGLVATVSNRRRGEIAFRFGDYKRVQGLIVVNQFIHPYGAADLVPELLVSEFPVHVMALQDLAAVATVLDTAADVLDYLGARSAILPKVKIAVGQELNLLAIYLSHSRSFVPINESDSTVRIDANAWRDFVDRHAQALNAEKEANVISKVIDHMIDAAHDVDPAWLTNTGTDATGPDAYAKIAAELSRMNRVERRVISAAMIAKARQAGQEGRDRYALLHISGGPAVVFLASPVEDHTKPPVREYRERRLSYLLHLTRLAKQDLAVDRIIGVATEVGTGSDAEFLPIPRGVGHSYDFAYIDAPHREDARLKAEALKFFGPPRHLTSEAKVQDGGA